MMMMVQFLSAIAVCLALAVGQGQAFVVNTRPSHQQSSRNRLSLNNNNNNNEDSGDSRRGFITQIIATTAATVMGATQGSSLFMLAPSQPAFAVGGLNKVNAKLQGYGLPPVTAVPDGFTPLCDIYGKGSNRFPLLITFNHPVTWVVVTPNNDANGEDGTIQAGEYAKGDTATLFVYTDPGHVDNIHNQPKELFEKALMKSIGQKGDNMYQNFKVTKLEPRTIGNQQYMICDFKYQLLTGAGFEVDRKGVASVISEGAAVEVLWTASTAVRFKKTEIDLRNIASSFRCYADGLNMSGELV